MGKRGRRYSHRGPDDLRPPDPDRVRVLPMFDDVGGLRPGAAREIHARTGVPEAEVWGTGSFYHLVARPDVEARVCTGLTCELAGADEVLADLQARGVNAEGCACLAQCDRAPAVLLTRTDHGYDVASFAKPGVELDIARPQIALTPSADDLAIDLAGDDDLEWMAFHTATGRAPADVCTAVADSGLRGRGGAGFPAGIKWRAVLAQTDPQRYIVCNADEGEPGTFKDREVMVRRPHLMLEGMAIAAHAVNATHLIIYLRGEFDGPRRRLEQAIAEARARGHTEGLRIEVALGHGAYICGEETALLEALEGRRGMPRHKPPFPTEAGLHGKPTLMNNVETFACVPSIVTRGAAWFEGLGRGDAAGSKLYSVSGHVAQPGVYELAMGATVAELIEAAGGVVGGALKAFSPGGASSGFLPASEVGLALDFGPLQAAGSMLGSAGVVILNEHTDMLRAAISQLRFFRDESCGQCAPCRVGTQVMVTMLERLAAGEGTTADVDTLARVGWEMEAGSICGLGQAAPFPVQHLLRFWPEELRRKARS